MKSASAVIDEKGAAVIAAALKVSTGRVRVWKTRNQFPRAVWPELVTAFPDLTLDKLKKLEREGERAA